MGRLSGEEKERLKTEGKKAYLSGEKNLTELSKEYGIAIGAIRWHFGLVKSRKPRVKSKRIVRRVTRNQVATVEVPELPEYSERLPFSESTQPNDKVVFILANTEAAVKILGSIF